MLGPRLTQAPPTWGTPGPLSGSVPPPSPSAARGLPRLQPWPPAAPRCQPKARAQTFSSRGLRAPLLPPQSRSFLGFPGFPTCPVRPTPRLSAVCSRAPSPGWFAPRLCRRDLSEPRRAHPTPSSRPDAGRWQVLPHEGSHAGSAHPPRAAAPPVPPPQAAGTGVAASKADLSHLCSVVARAAPAPRLHGAAQVLPIHTCVADLPHFLTSPPHPSPPPPPRGKKPSFRLVLSLGPGRSPRNGRRCCTGCVVRSDLGLRRLFPGRKWGREGEPAVLDAGEPGLGSLVSETSLLFGFSN